MRILRERMSEDGYLVAVADSEYRVITFGVFADEDAAAVAAGVISALIEKAGLSQREKIEGVRCVPFASMVESIKEMENSGVGSLVEEITA